MGTCLWQWLQSSPIYIHLPSMNNGFLNLALNLPAPCLVCERDGIEISATALQEPVAPISNALAAILNTPHAGKLLLGLNELFGSASEYAITGSTAVALHCSGMPAQPFRIPNDLDVVVTPSGMCRLGNIDHQGLATVGFACEPGNTESVVWLGHGEKPLRVDVINRNNGIAGRGFERSVDLQGVRVIPLDQLAANLQQRIDSNLGSEHTLDDLAFIHQWVQNNLTQA